MEKEEISAKINDDALYILCEWYDAENGEYPEHKFEGKALYDFYKKEIN
jgi:hypothetical protein